MIFDPTNDADLDLLACLEAGHMMAARICPICQESLDVPELGPSTDGFHDECVR